MRARERSRNAVVPHSPDGFISAAVLRVVAVYVVLSVLWITLSDQVVVLMFSDPRHIALVSTIKGYVFVAATASLLAIMLHRYLKAQAEESNRLATLMRLASDGIHVLDLQGNVLQVNDRFCRMMGYGRDELLRMNVLDWVPDLPREDFDQAVAEICKSGDSLMFESQNRRRDGSTLEVEISAAAIEVGGQRLLHCTSRDITERKRADEQRQLLINELNHRVKNTLATVQSLVMQTLRTTERSADARPLVDARLAALARAHDLLTAENWEGAYLREVVERALKAFAAGARVEVGGPVVRLTPKQALALSIALHELATNAAKYGALSNEKGRVNLSWEVCGEGGAELLQLTWRESGGPVVSPPARAGFGSRLIERNLAFELNGEARIAYRPEGVEAFISTPVERRLVYQWEI